MMVKIDDKLTVDDAELSFRFARSGGPGGQNVNKLSTKVILYFDIVNSISLDENQKRMILDRLDTRISKAGLLRVISQKHRSQKANREEAIRRFAEMIRGALTLKPARIATALPKSASEKRLEKKKKQSRKKQQRRKDIEWD